MKNKKIVFFFLPIIQLLISLTNSYGQNNYNSSFTGDSLVSLPISTIKLATIKIIERNEYKEICSQKDSIILNYKDYINLQDIQIENLKFENYQLMTQNDDYIRINEDIADALSKQKRKTLYLGGIASAAIVTTIILI